MPAARPLNRPSAPAGAVVIPSAYEDLLRDVRSALFTGRVKIEYAWLMMFHDIGRLIHTHLLLNQDRAGYAAKTFSRLAADTGVSRRVLYEWVQFFRFFPIVRQSAQLTRTHYRLLCQVGDDKQRQVLTAQATKKKWTCPELQERVRALNAAASSDAMGSNGAGAAGCSTELLTPKRGIVGLYRVVARKRGLAVDVGFKEYLPLTAAQAREFADGDIVSMHGGRLAVVKTAKPADLFTYRALDHRVIDGDPPISSGRTPDQPFCKPPADNTAAATPRADRRKSCAHRPHTAAESLFLVFTPPPFSPAPPGPAKIVTTVPTKPSQMLIRG